MSRGGLALELAAPTSVGPFDVEIARAELPGVSFPVELTGGVSRFRHRRGRLVELRVGVPLGRLARYAEAKLSGLWPDLEGRGAVRVLLVPREGGISIEVGSHEGLRACAFELLVCPLDAELRLVVDRARGLGLDEPAHAVALRALKMVIGKHGRWVGGVPILSQPAQAIGRWLFPEAGARAPVVGTLRWKAPIAPASSRMMIEARGEGAPPVLTPDALSALEAAELALDADEALRRGDWESARRGYCDLLERAPRHAELSRRLAALDHAIGGRNEAALSTIVDAMSAVDAGPLGASLLEAIDDRAGAENAYWRAAESEPFGLLAGLCLIAAARTTESHGGRLAALDAALLRAPGLAEVRRQRLDEHIRAGRRDAAVADAEHLEAAARGAHERYEACAFAAACFEEGGFVELAIRWFERALRYEPDRPGALVGLAEGLRALGHGGRALDVLARAVALSERRGARDYRAELALAKLLVEVAQDRPAAVSRARSVPNDSSEAVEARLCEARWREELGDVAGTRVALERLRGLVERLARPVPQDRARRLAALLVAAADVEERLNDESTALVRTLSLAVALAPRDGNIAARFRRVAGSRQDRGPDSQRDQVPASSTSVVGPEDGLVSNVAGHEVPPALSSVGATAALIDPAETSVVGPELEARIEQLSEIVRADPSNHRAVFELADCLEEAHRDLDLLALVSGRLEEEVGDDRDELLNRRHRVLSRLAADCRLAGRHDEAALYEEMRDAD